MNGRRGVGVNHPPTLLVASVKLFKVVDFPLEGLPTKPIKGSRGILRLRRAVVVPFSIHREPLVRPDNFVDKKLWLLVLMNTQSWWGMCLSEHGHFLRRIRREIPIMTLNHLCPLSLYHWCYVLLYIFIHVGFLRQDLLQFII